MYIFVNTHTCTHNTHTHTPAAELRSIAGYHDVSKERVSGREIREARREGE